MSYFLKSNDGIRIMYTKFTAKLRLALSFLLLTAIAGCAALPTDVELAVETIPEGAHVSSNTGWSCTSPCSQRVANESELSLSISHAGYATLDESVQIDVSKPQSATRAGLLLGVIAMYLAADISDDIASSLVSAITTTDTGSVLTTGDKLLTVGIGGLVGWSVGRWIDHQRHIQRLKKPVKVSLELKPE